MRMRLSLPELKFHNAGVYSLGQREEIMSSAAESAWYGFFMRQLRLEFFRYAKHL
jgi:hypothetical protein